MRDKEILGNKSFPSNSKKDRDKPKIERKRIKKVVSGTVKRQKRGFFKKAFELFFEDDTKSVGDYVLHDVLVPAAKSLVCDIVGWGGMAEMILFGSKRGGRTKYESGRPRTSYGAYYNTSDRRDRDREMSRQGRARHDFGEIKLETRGEAEEVLHHLVDLTIDYDMATVADLYDLVGIESSYTDSKYGWTDLHLANVRPVRDGYVINLPRTQLLE